MVYIYLQIADFICKKVILNEWGIGERIPSVRELAEKLRVNPNTIMRTFTFLQEKQILFNKRGIGYFVSEEGFINARKYKKEIFLNEELEYFFDSIHLLNINFLDLNDVFEEYKSNYPST